LELFHPLLEGEKQPNKINTNTNTASTSLSAEGQYTDYYNFSKRDIQRSEIYTTG